MELRNLPGYGKGFALDRSRIVFNGDPMKLVYVLKNGLVDDIIVEVYPMNIDEKDRDELDCNWILHQLKEYYSLFYYYPPKETHVSNRKKMAEAIGTHRLHFVCSFKPNSPIRNSTLSIEERLKQLGRYPDVTEMFFYMHVIRGFNKPMEYIEQRQGTQYRDFINVLKLSNLYGEAFLLQLYFYTRKRYEASFLLLELAILDQKI